MRSTLQTKRVISSKKAHVQYLRDHPKSNSNPKNKKFRNYQLFEIVLSKRKTSDNRAICTRQNKFPHAALRQQWTSRDFPFLVQFISKRQTSNMSTLTLLYTIIIATPAIGQLINVFSAYDCTVPKNLKDYGFTAAQWCAHETSHHVRYVNKTYQVLQAEHHHRVKGFACTREQTRRVRHCGVADWQTTLDLLGYTKLYKPLTLPECRELWATESYDVKGVEEVLHCPKGTLCNFGYHTKGRSYIWNGAQGTGQGSCDGETTFLNGQRLDNAVIYYEDQIVIEEVEIAYGPDGVYAKGSDFENKLTCKVTENGCKTPLRTLGWAYDPTHCGVYTLRDPVRGQEVVSEKGKVVFMSTDGSLIRLVKKESVNICNKIVYKTDHEDFYLYDVTDKGSHEYFPKELNPGERILSTFVKVQDAAIYDLIRKEIRNEYNHVVQADCRRQYDLAKKTFWHQHRDPGLVTWVLGDNTFATTAGSVLYHYQCEPVRVRARTESRCYNALPVEIIAYAAGRNESEPTIEGPIFMEPLTHRLVHHAAEIPCSRQMPSKYPTDQGTWVLVAPEILEAKPPSEPDRLEESKHIMGLPEIDWSAAGLYTDEDLRGINRYLEFGRAKDSLVATVTTYLTPSSDQSHHSYPHYSGTYPSFGTWAASWLWTVWDFFRVWGNIASVFLSVYMCWRIGAGLISWTYAFIMLRKVHGCSRILCWIPCTSAFLLRTYRNIYKQADPPEDPPQIIKNTRTSKETQLHTAQEVNYYTRQAQRSAKRTRLEEVPSAPPVGAAPAAPISALDALYQGMKRLKN